MQFNQLFSDPTQVSPFMQYLESQELAEGEILFDQGSEAVAVYFLESGQISTFIECQTDRATQLQTLKAGTLLGELDFYRRSPYATTAVADQLSTVYRLARESLEKMQQDHPQAAATFQTLMIQLLADQLVQSQKEVNSLRL